MIKFDATKLAAVALVQSTEETRYYLNGVYFFGKLAVATDGHILTVAYDEHADNGKEGVILPVDKSAASKLKNKKAVTALFDDDLLKVYDANGNMMHVSASKRIDGTFPDFRKVVPDEFGSSLKTPFTPVVVEQITATARILKGETIGGFYLTGKDNNSPHLVRYDGSPDVFTIAMPKDWESGNKGDVPSWFELERPRIARGEEAA
ncbi:MAG: hypothetical protein ABJN40_13265 [Sneathiella sp.]